MPDDDMNDKAAIQEYENRPELRRFAEALAFCDHVIDPAFRDTDAAALAAQRTYFKYANAAAWFGVLAVLLAILQLSHLGMQWPNFERLLPRVELLFAFSAVTVALAGLRGRKQQKWLLTRYQAERLRLLKFGFLTHPHLWSGEPEAAAKHIQEASAKIEDLKASQYPELQCWISEGTLPEVLTAPALSEEEWRAFRSYYQGRRLQKQTRYFLERLSRNTKRDDRTKILPSVFFFGSVAAVLAHFGIELALGGEGGEGGRGVETAMLAAAAALPSLGALVRAVRGVLEFARNASRCESTHHVLLKLGARLRNARDAAEGFREIGFCEQALEADLREWLRLMVESEWFG